MNIACSFEVFHMGWQPRHDPTKHLAWDSNMLLFIGNQWHVNLCGSTSCCFLLISISGHHYLISFHEIHAVCCPKCFPTSLDPVHIPSYTFIFIINRKVVCDLPTISSTHRILPQQIHHPEIATQNPWQTPKIRILPCPFCRVLL